VQKTVATDPTKASKAGRFAVVDAPDGRWYVTMPEATAKNKGVTNHLQTVFEDGELVDPVGFQTVRETAQKWRGVS
jgi:hypothetical protein